MKRQFLFITIIAILLIAVQFTSGQSSLLTNKYYSDFSSILNLPLLQNDVNKKHGRISQQMNILPAPMQQNGHIAYTQKYRDNESIRCISISSPDCYLIISGGITNGYYSYSSDGTKIVYQSDRDRNNEIYIMNSDGSNQTRLTNDPAYDAYPAFSPDGTRIVFVRDGSVYVMNSDGSGQTSLNTPNLAYFPMFSPNNSKIAFVTLNDELFIMNSDGSNRILLASGADNNYRPKFSPDGTKIVFIRDIGVFQYEIYTVDVNNLTLNRLTNNNVGEYDPVFSPDGSKIAFVRNTDLNRQIFIMNSDGSNQVQLTNNGYAEEPIFSPDGSKIIFDGWDQAIGDGIYVMNSNGSNKTRLVAAITSYGNRPVFSPDGTKISYDAHCQDLQFCPNDNNEIYVMNSNGSNQTRLTYNFVKTTEASYSNDGRKIVFTENRNNDFEIFIQSVNEYYSERLTNNSVKDYSPVVSPNGAKVAFTSDRDGNEEIYLMNADGTNQTRLTNNSASDSDPTFSADGTKIAFSTNRDGNQEIYVMNTDGSNQTRITTNPASDFQPAFSFDGSKIAFATNRDGNVEIYIMNSNGSSQTRLTNNAAKDILPAFSPDGTKVTFTRTIDGNDFGRVFTIDINGAFESFITNGRDPTWQTSPSESEVNVSVEARDGNYYPFGASLTATSNTTGNTFTPNSNNTFTLPIGDSYTLTAQDTLANGQQVQFTSATTPILEPYQIYYRTLIAQSPVFNIIGILNGQSSPSGIMVNNANGAVVFPECEVRLGGQTEDPPNSQNKVVYKCVGIPVGTRSIITPQKSGTTFTPNSQSFPGIEDNLQFNFETGQPVAITVTTNPTGRTFIVDGTAYTSALPFNWVSGSQHTISVSPIQNGATGTRYVFTNWSDGNTQNPRTITTPVTATTYTAVFKTQHQLTTSVNPVSSGSISANPSSADGWYDAGQSVQLTATANSGYSFSGWIGTVNSNNNPLTLTVNGPVTQTANFTQNPVPITIGSSPAGRTFTYNSVTYTTPKQFDWQPNSQHTIAFISPQNGSAGTRYIFDRWSDNSSVQNSRVITVPSSAATYTANFTTQYQLTMNAGAGGTVSPLSGNWYDAGQQVQISAVPNSGFTFGSWSGSGSGSYSGSNNPVNITLNNPITQTAGFNACAFTLSSNSQSFNAGGGNGSFGLTTMSGCGWTASSNSPWLHVTNGGSGTNSGTVGFSVDPNSGGARTGTITAGGQFFTVNQSQTVVVRNASFDFDGDRKTDISIFRPAPAEWWYLRSSNSSNRAVQFGLTSDKIVPADFTGDGKTDIAFFRPSTGQWFVIRSEDDSFYAFPFGSNGDIPVPADFDGDGKADPTVFRPSNAVWYTLRSSDGQYSFTQFGVSEDVPLPNDYDGDGKADYGVFRPTPSEWWILKSTGGVSAFQFGSAGDKPTPADFTGDGKTDAAFWRPSNGFWYVLRSEDLSYYAFPFGANGDIPAPGDYDGDGRADAAVFRPANLVWYLQQTTNGIATVPFGIAGDIPVPSAYLP